jgi:Zn finger protein HypA/HybF involved in hydrogenase expression
MFKRTGAPTKIEKVAFDLKTAKEIFCPSCQAYVGLTSGGTYKQAGKKAEIPLSGFQAKCPKCESSFNV